MAALSQANKLFTLRRSPPSSAPSPPRQPVRHSSPSKALSSRRLIRRRSTFGPAEITRAQAILDQYESARESGRGAYGLQGADGQTEMIDAPMVPFPFPPVSVSVLRTLETEPCLTDCFRMHAAPAGPEYIGSGSRERTRLREACHPAAARGLGGRYFAAAPLKRFGLVPLNHIGGGRETAGTEGQDVGQAGAGMGACAGRLFFSADYIVAISDPVLRRQIVIKATPALWNPEKGELTSRGGCGRGPDGDLAGL